MATDEFVFTAGSDWADFLATVVNPYTSAPIERLGDPQALDRWLSAVGLTPTRPATDSDLDEVRSTRSALHAVVGERFELPQRREEPSPAEGIAILEKLVERQEAIHIVEADDWIGVSPPTDALQAIRRLVISALDDLSRDPAAYATCEEPTCRKIFVRSGRARAYCSPRCATRHRVRVHRQGRYGNE